MGSLSKLYKVAVQIYKDMNNFETAIILSIG